jgi:geranylgeranyl reductase family protein
VDVLVVGAGPAGSRAAEAAAQAGAKALLVEAKRRAGALPHCAEFVPQALALEMRMPERARVQAVTGMETRLAGALGFLPTPGWILDRQVFDFALAAGAARAGAEVWTGTRLLGRENGRWRLKRGGEVVEIQAGAVVAADGAASPTARALGLKPPRTLPGVQVVAPLAAPLTRTLIFLRSEIMGGYAWLFPRGQVANLGLGCAAQAGPWPLLEALRRELMAQGLILPGALGKSVGAIPVDGPRPQPWRENVFLAGDAAGLTHPLSGAGIPQAVFSGAEAGAAAAALAGGSGQSALDDYAQALTLRYGRYLARGLAARARWEADWESGDFVGLMRETWPGLGKSGQLGARRGA